MSVLWTLNNGSYEVSSKNHLLQIMHNGGLFQNAGPVPPNYRSVDFIQTADIDLESDITNIRVITIFSGTYDGQGHRVSNWSCTALSGKGTGFFGHTSNATIRNMVLDGVWKTLGVNDGAFFAAHNTGSHFYNITTDFAPGTEITCTQDSLGGLFAYTGACTLQNITLGGTIDRFEGTAYTGGVVGFSGYSSGSTFSYIRNIATFTAGIVNTGDNVGGVFGRVGHDDSLSYVINAMRGSIHGPINTGGIIGNVDTVTLHHVCNSMIGDISGTKSSAIAAVVTGGGTPTHIVNYMTGDVNSGFVGTVTSTTFSSCIVAMTGATTYAAFASGHGSSQVLLDESYGVTYASSSGTVGAMDTSTFETHPSFDLPYWDISSLDNASNSVEWSFVFGNVGTTTNYDWIAKVGSGVDTRFVGTNVLSVYDVYDEAQLLTTSPRAVSIAVTVLVGDATAYRLTVQEAGSSTERVVVNNFADPNQTIDNLIPETEYTVRLYSTTGSEYILEAESVVTTLVNSPASFDVSDYGTEGNYNLSSLDPESVGLISDLFNDIFTTGDSIEISVPGKSVTKAVKFVNRGANVTITDTEALLAPFSNNAGAGQSITLILSDSSSVEVLYDQTTEAITIGSDSYTSGESFVLDGRKATIVDL
jgi:hypothetical protein